jgi:hypothetical protein
VGWPRDLNGLDCQDHYTVTGLFWLRRKKLQQIADRWFVLHNILQHHLIKLPIEETLDAIVEKDLRTTRYTRKDLCLCLSISAPIYGLFAVSLHEQFGTKLILYILTIVMIVLVHLAIAAMLMIRPFKCPEPLTAARKKRMTNKDSQ